MKQKINLRLGFIALIAVVLTALGTIFVCYNLVQSQVQNDLKLNAQLLVKTEVFQEAYASAGKNATEIDRVMLSRLGNAEMRITWVDAEGNVLFDNDNDADGLDNHLDRPEIQDAMANGYGESTRHSDTMGMNTFYYALLLEDGTVLRLSKEASAITGVFRTVLPVILSVSLLILLLCIVIGHFLTRQLIHSIEEMAEKLDENNQLPVYKELEPFAGKIRAQHEKILAAARSRQDFTASVSHELKTPLTAVSGYAELIENGMVDSEQQIHAAKQIRHNADRLQALITDIIQLSELDHPELPRQYEQLDLFRLATDCVNNLQPLAREKDIRLSCDGVSAGIRADEGLIREMIENLVRNAISYNTLHGRVGVYVSIENGHPVLLVEDNGIGISKEHQERVFERFYRVDKSRSRETGGTGLGLAIVKHIAELHSADIILESTPGVGSSFKIVF